MMHLFEVPSTLFSIQVLLCFFDAGEGSAHLDDYLRGRGVCEGNEGTRLRRILRAAQVLYDPISAPGAEVGDIFPEADSEVAVETCGLACALIDTNDGVIADNLVLLRPDFDEALPHSYVGLHYKMPCSCRRIRQPQHSGVQGTC